jgi:hypothetical protein
VRSRSEGNRYSAGLYCNNSESRGDGDSMAVVKWQVTAEHVKRRVHEWKCKTKRVGWRL